MADETDANRSWYNIFFRGGNDNPKPVILSKIPVVEYLANVYNVSHKNRGIALIFNHEYFDDRSLKRREGTMKDKEDLTKALEKLEFDVRAYDNLKYGQLYEVLKEVSLMDHTHSDCLLICVMSHGDEGLIYARDHSYPSDMLWLQFTGSECKTLAGKPKMFFIQACRGSEVDEGAQVRDVTKTDSSRNEGSVYRVPAMADILVMYSTYHGYFSWRSPDNGSWFIQSLVKELNENGDRCDLLTLLTLVNRRVALFHQSNVPDNHQLHHKKQICTIVSMFTRIMWFPPKDGQNEEIENKEEENVMKDLDDEVFMEELEQSKLEDQIDPVMKVKAKIIESSIEK